MNRRTFIKGLIAGIVGLFAGEKLVAKAPRMVIHKGSSMGWTEWEDIPKGEYGWFCEVI